MPYIRFPQASLRVMQKEWISGYMSIVPGRSEERKRGQSRGWVGLFSADTRKSYNRFSFLPWCLWIRSPGGQFRVCVGSKTAALQVYPEIGGPPHRPVPSKRVPPQTSLVEDRSTPYWCRMRKKTSFLDHSCNHNRVYTVN